MTWPFVASAYGPAPCPGCVQFHEDLPDDAVEGSMCVVLEGALYVDCIFLRTGGRWVQMACAVPQLAPESDRVRRRPVTCGMCGAPVSPQAAKCEHCGAWFE